MADLPRSTVTFLFTDIEGSTACWERNQPAMAAARQIALLDAAIAAHGASASRPLEMPHRPPSRVPLPTLTRSRTAGCRATRSLG
jgi:hypothetical protein